MLVMTARFGLNRSIHDKCITQAEVAGMRRVSQRVDDPQIEIFQRAPALARDVADIGRVRGVADAIAECRYVAVLQEER